MTETSKGQPGWRVILPPNFNSPPSDRSELIQRVENIQGTQVPQVVFLTEQEATENAIRVWRESLASAIGEQRFAEDLKNDLKKLDRDNRLRDAKKQRNIAEEALRLLGHHLEDDDDGLEPFAS